MQAYRRTLAEWPAGPHIPFKAGMTQGLAERERASQLYQNDPNYQGDFARSLHTRPLACDFPNCRNPIANRCNLCGRAMCVRHIQWIGTQGSHGMYLSGHYRCDICTQQLQVRQRAEARKSFRMAKKLLLVGLIVSALGLLTTPLGVGGCILPIGLLILFFALIAAIYPFVGPIPY